MNEEDNHTNNLSSIESLKKELEDFFFLTSASEVFENQSSLLETSLSNREKDLIKSTLDIYQKRQVKGLSLFVAERLEKVITNSAMKEANVHNKSFSASFRMHMNNIHTLYELFNEQMEMLENEKLDLEIKNKMETQLKNHLDKYLDEMEKQFQSYQNFIDSL